MKNYLIIGGSSGIGKALSEKLANAGHQVFATFNQHKPQVERSNITYTFLDVLEDELNMDFLPESIQGLVYCPGSINLKPFSRIKPTSFAEDYQLQVIGAVKVIQTVLPRLKSAGNASILLFSTVAVQTGFQFHAQVSASKGAIEGLTRSLAAEFAPAIRVNAIAPSLTDTPLASKLLGTDEKREANAQRHPLKKIGSPEEIADAAAFLLSEGASWTTGQIMHIDGGMSAIK